MPNEEYRDYRVRWEIDVPARDAEEAARIALEVQRDPRSTATLFHVARRGVEDEGVDVDAEADLGAA